MLYYRLVRDLGLVAQLVSAHACHAWGRGFESRPVRQVCSLIAQLVEHLTVNQVVPGSSPGRGAKERAECLRLV